jgi:hypothetical protein
MGPRRSVRFNLVRKGGLQLQDEPDDRNLTVPNLWSVRKDLQSRTNIVHLRTDRVDCGCVQPAIDGGDSDGQHAGSDAFGFGGHVITAQTILADIQNLADGASREILVKADQVAIAEGEIRLWTCREGKGFGRFVLNPSTSSDRRQHRLAQAQVQHLATEVKAKILARAASIDSAARKVTITIRPQGAGFDIGITVDYR